MKDWIEGWICIGTMHIVCKFCSNVRKRSGYRKSKNEPERLDTSLVRGAIARRGSLTNDLWVRTIPCPQKVVQLHARVREIKREGV